ncbi:MAG: endo-1,4-beta-xylanase [Prevotella sp.]|nr:endo-1,4-beta-xylanase [Prevotella sp.]
MRKNLLLAAVMLLTATGTHAQKNYEMGNPNDPNYSYLKDYGPLKSYVDREKYPNFKLGVGTTVNNYLSNSTVKGLTNDNFDETVAGNAMKMSWCVDGNGDMNFNTVKDYVNTATAAGLNVYGHTLAWHSQQAVGWLSKLLADKQETGPNVWYSVASKDFRSNQTIPWKSDESKYGYTLKFDGTNGLNVHCTKKNTNYWDVQFQAINSISVTVGKTYKLTMTVRGTQAGKFHSKFGDWKGGSLQDIPFTTEWTDVEVNYTPTVASSFLLLQCGDFVGDIYVKSIKIEYYAGTNTPLTAQEKHDTLVWAMDKWIKGMMDACGGKVKAWDVVNEAISGGGDDGSGNYVLQHTDNYNGDTWDVGGDAFFWQDYLGDLDYVRTAVRLARKYGPSDVKLFINDYNLESDWDNNKKLRSLINWINKWEADGVTKIDGIGTQMHISCFENATLQNNAKKHITQMFELMAATGKLVRVSEFDMGYARGSGRWTTTKVMTSQMTEAEHQKMADFYEWIIKEYLRIVPPAQQWGICLWCPTDSPTNSGWRAGEPVGLWTLNTYYRKHTYAGVAKGLGADLAGIEDIFAEDNANSAKGIYTLTGIRLPEATDFGSLPAGIYIVNGKKINKTR